LPARRRYCRNVTADPLEPAGKNGCGNNSIFVRSYQIE
jgi:hypothetical protein